MDCCASKRQDLKPGPAVRSNCPRLKCTCRILPTRINHHSNTSSHTNYPNYEYCQKVYERVNKLDYRISHSGDNCLFQSLCSMYGIYHTLYAAAHEKHVLLLFCGFPLRRMDEAGDAKLQLKIKIFAVFFQQICVSATLLHL